MTYKKNTRLEIEWLDIVDEPSWMNEEEILTPIETYCKSVGYYLKENETFLWISWSISARKRKGLRSYQMIPKGTIKKIRELQVKRKK